MKTLNYSATIGSHIQQAAREATRLAKSHRALVRMDFNDVLLRAAPKKSASTLLWEFTLGMSRAASNYRQSEKGQQEARRRALEVLQRQDAVTAAIRSLPGLLEINNLDHLMGWLHSFVEHADDVGVDFNAAAGLTSGGLEWIAVLFEAKGYRQGEGVGQSPDWFTTRERLGRYVIGQALECIRSGMPPHPITQKFVADYFKLPA